MKILSLKNCALISRGKEKIKCIYVMIIVVVAISRSLDALYEKAVTQYILVSINMKQTQR